MLFCKANGSAVHRKAGAVRTLVTVTDVSSALSSLWVSLEQINLAYCTTLRDGICHFPPSDPVPFPSDCLHPSFRPLSRATLICTPSLMWRCTDSPRTVFVAAEKNFCIEAFLPFFPIEYHIFFFLLTLPNLSKFLTLLNYYHRPQ